MGKREYALWVMLSGTSKWDISMIKGQVRIEIPGLSAALATFIYEGIKTSLTSGGKEIYSFRYAYSPSVSVIEISGKKVDNLYKKVIHYEEKNVRHMPVKVYLT
jgi:hypothetical protein